MAAELYLSQMIAYLKGKYVLKTPAMVYMEVNGVGYEVNVSLNTYDEIKDKDEGKLYTYLQIKEDAHTLFGFSDMKEKEMFLSLIGVSGVGATTARMMLSGLKPDEITSAIITGNAGLLQSIKGIGKKTAERLILELRDRIGKSSGFKMAEDAGGPGGVVNLNIDAINALVALGISHPMAESAVRKVLSKDKEITELEDLIKKALKNI